MPVFAFIKAALSEEPTVAGQEGTPSFSRIAASFIIAFVLTWVTYLVFKTHAMPDLAGPTLFMTGGAGATYGANRVTTAVSDAIANKPPDQPVVAVVPVVPVTSTTPTQVGN